MRFIRTDFRACGIVITALAITAIVVPAASARLDLGPAQPQIISAVHVVQPNPDQQIQAVRRSVPPVLAPARGSDVAATRRAEGQQAQALSYSVPRTARYSTAELNAYGSTVHPVGASTPRTGTQSDSFDWGDAAIGAAVAATIGLLLTATALAVRRRSQLGHA